MNCGVCNARNADNATVCRSCGSPLSTVSAGPSTTALQPGTRLAGGKFAVEKVLGQGGFGITYLAREASLGRKVAIKEFFPYGGCTRQRATVHPGGQLSAADYQLARQKFLDEARILAQFHHQGIVQVYATFEENNTAYFVMEFVEGKTLLSVVESRGALPEKEVVGYARQVGDALTVVHQANLLHRDIKPENVLLRKNGQVVLVDFGTTRQFTSGKTGRMTAMFTAGYAPIEQYGQQARFGPYTDVYALGATCYHLLTGDVPVAAADRAQGVDLPHPCRRNRQVSRTVSDAVMWAMEMRAGQRPQSAQEFIKALVGTAPAQQPAAPPRPQPAPMRPPPAPLPVSRPPAPAKWLALAYLGLLVLGAFAHPALLGLLIAAGVLACVPLAIGKRPVGHTMAAVGCVIAPLIGAWLGSYGNGIVANVRNHLEASQAASQAGSASPGSPSGTFARPQEPANKHASFEKKPTLSSGFQPAWSLEGKWTGVACDEGQGAIYAIGNAECVELDLAGKKRREINISESGGPIVLRMATLPGTTGKALLTFGLWGADLKAYDLYAKCLWSYPSGDGIDDVWPCDLNSDGYDEIVVGHNGATGLHVLNSMGQVVWKNTGNGNHWDVCAGDVLGEGKPQVICTSVTGRVHVFGSTGKPIKELDAGCYATMVRVGKLSKEGNPVILVAGSPRGSSGEILTAMSGEGAQKWSLDLPSPVQKVESAQLGRGRPWLALGMRSGQVDVVDIEKGEVIAFTNDQGGLPGEIPQVAWASCKDGEMPLLLVATGNELNAFHVVETRYSPVLAERASSVTPPSRKKARGPRIEPPRIKLP
jgi:predicted Ser/Thr protein kinase